MMRLPLIRLVAGALAMALVASLAALPGPAHAQQGACGTAPQPRLTVGEQGRVAVNTGIGSNLRAQPTTTATVMGMLSDGEVFVVIDGPQCAENFWWWQVRSTRGAEGWIAEGTTTEYWAEPWAALPPTPAISMGERPNLPGVQLAYYSGAGDQLLPYLMNADGSGARTLAPILAFDNRLVWSPDGQWIAFSDGNDLYMVSRDGAIFTNLTNTPSVSEYWPTWSPDSMRIAYVSQAGDTMDIHMRAVNGRVAAALTDDAGRDGWPAWSPDGTRIAFASDRGGSFDIYTMSAADGSDVQRITQDPLDETHPAWSPDGASLALLSVDDVFSNLLVIQPPFSATVVTTEQNITDFAWSPDGKRIAYVAEVRLLGGQFEVFSTRSDLWEPLQLTLLRGQIAGLSWSPDGEYLAFASSGAGAYDIYAIHQGGFGLARLTENTVLDTFPVFMPPTAALAPVSAATPVPAPTAIVAPTAVVAPPVSAEGQDLLLIYDPTVPVFTLINVSGSPLNLLPISFQGAGRTVSADIWTTFLPAASPITNFQAGGCVMLWPWGLPEQSPPPECGLARQGWVTDATAVFWTMGSFTVLYSGTPIATCDVNARSCGINLP